MFVNPCICGSSLKTGTKILGIIDMIFATLSGIIFTTLFAFGIMVYTSDEVPHDFQDLDNKFITVWIIITSGIIALLIIVSQFICGLVLFQGSNQMDLKKCRIWFVASYIFLVVKIALFISVMITTPPSAEDFVWVGLNIFSILYRSYSLVVVYAFMEELLVELPNNIGELK